MLFHRGYGLSGECDQPLLRRQRRRFAGVVLFALAGTLISVQSGLGAPAADPGAIVAIVNDEPISEFDIAQRVKLLVVMRAVPPKATATGKIRKQVLDQLVDEMLQRQEASRLKVKVKDADLDAAIKRVASRFGPNATNLTERLMKRGIGLETLKEQIDASIAWQRIVRSRFRALLKVTDAQVNKRFEQAKNNPVAAKVFYVLKRIVLPISKRTSPAIMQSRLIEARTIQQRFRGCARIRKATENIFDVRVINMNEVPAAALPKPFRKQLDRMGPGRLSSPGRGRGGIEMIAYCSKKVVRAPEPTRKVVENQIVREQLSMMSGRYLRDLRRDATIEMR